VQFHELYHCPRILQLAVFILPAHKKKQAARLPQHHKPPQNLYRGTRAVPLLCDLPKGESIPSPVRQKTTPRDMARGLLANNKLSSQIDKFS